MVNALVDARKLGLDTVQVFTKNQQQWTAKPLDAAMVADWRAEAARIGFTTGGPTDAKGQRRGGITSHASYLINLAAPDDTLWKKSIDLMVDEIERCENLGIPFLVHHPGAFTTSSLDEGLARIASAYKQIFARTKGFATVSCLEGTVGAGSQIGGPFEELARLRELIIAQTGEPARIGFCLDTCHMHAAGYDMSARAAADTALATFDRLCGLAHLKAFHINDSKGACASHLDRHAHIGHGTIGGPPEPGAPLVHDRLLNSGFAAVVNHPALRDVPKHLETPKEDPLDDRAWDTLNVARLRSLLPGQQAQWPTPPAGEQDLYAAAPLRKKSPKSGPPADPTPKKGQQSKPSPGADRKKAKTSTPTASKKVAPTEPKPKGAARSKKN